VPLSLTSVEVLSQPDGPLSPFGTTAGGDQIQITGRGFIGGCVVLVGGTPGTVTQVSSQQVLATTPPGPAGFATITVSNPGGETANLAGTFQYVAPPAVLSVVLLTGPTTGENRAPIAGGETGRITGANLKSGLTVRVGGVAAPTTFVDPTTATFTVPATANEQVSDIVVTNPEGLGGTLTRGLIYTAEFSLVQATNSLTDARANHLFRRAAFGAPPDVIQQAKQDGLVQTVNRLLTYTNAPAVENEALTMYGARPPPTDNLNDRNTKHWWIHLLLNNPNPLQERLAWFLHDHFATSEQGFNANFRWTLYNQINLFRRFSVAKGDQLASGAPGLGYDWKALLIETVKDRAMLEWLDGRQSTRFAPNENHPRELWELFMLGEGNGYTEDDIKQAAKAMTGFYWYYPDTSNPDHPFLLDIAYRPSRHDADPKTILGATGHFGYDSVSPFYEVSTNPITTDPSIETDSRDTEGGIVALTLRQRPVEASRFIVYKLWEFFVYENPHDDVIDPLAQQLRAAGPNQWNLKPILDVILKSKAMYSSRAMKGDVKGPVDYVFGFLRSTNIRLHPNIATNAARIRLALIDMDQVVLAPPDVSGWPSGLTWMGSQTMLERYNFLALAVKELDDQTGDILPLLPAPNPSPTELVDHIATLLDVQLSGNARSRYIEYVTSDWVGGQQVPFAYDPNNPDHVKLKTRGLIWMIAQYHDAHRK